MDKQIKVLVVVRNGLVEEVRSNGDLKGVGVLVMDIDATPLTEHQENEIAAMFPSKGEVTGVDAAWLEREGL